MKIGIIGAGAIGQAFAKHVAKAGYDVLISNSRGPASLSELVKNLGGNVSAVTVQEAADADVVFLALKWEHIQNVAATIPSWEGKIVIDPTNPILPGFVIADLGGKPSSEVVSSWLPGAKLVKAFNTFTPAMLAADPKEAGGSRVIFFSGNDDTAKAIVSGIIHTIGFAGIDLGRLDEGGKLQQFPSGVLPALNLIKL